MEYRRGFMLQQAEFPGSLDGFLPAVDPQFGVDLVDVPLDRAGGKRLQPGDLLAGAFVSQVR